MKLLFTDELNPFLIEFLAIFLEGFKLVLTPEQYVIMSFLFNFLFTLSIDPFFQKCVYSINVPRPYLHQIICIPFVSYLGGIFLSHVSCWLVYITSNTYIYCMFFVSSYQKSGCVHNII